MLKCGITIWRSLSQKNTIQHIIVPAPSQTISNLSLAHLHQNAFSSKIWRYSIVRFMYKAFYSLLKTKCIIYVYLLQTPHPMPLNFEICVLPLLKTNKIETCCCPFRITSTNLPVYLSSCNNIVYTFQKNLPNYN